MNTILHPIDGKIKKYDSTDKEDAHQEDSKGEL